MTALENATVSFEVSVSHDTVPVKWFHKNVEIKPSNKHRLVSERKVHVQKGRRARGDRARG